MSIHLENQNGEPNRPTISLESIRNPLVLNTMVALLLVWLLYTVSSFRFPTNPIVLSDSNAGSGIRQIVFAGAGMTAIAFVFLYRGIGSLIALRLPYFGLIALMLCSILWSDAPTLTIKRSAIFVFGLMTLLVLVHASQSPVRLMVRSLVYSSSAFALLSLIFHFILPNHCTVNPARPGLAGISVHPNTLGPFLSIGLLLSLSGFHRHNKERVLLRISQLMLLISLVMTLSMTTIVTTLVGVVMYMLLSANRYHIGIYQISTLLVVTIVAIIGIGTLKSSFFDAVGRDESLSGRDQLWEVIRLEVGKSPVLGSGFGAFWTEGKGREITQTWNPRQSHHGYLDIMLDLGGIGLIVVLVLFPLKLFTRWGSICGTAGSQKRRILSAMYASVFCYMCFYSFSQSYFLKFDSYPFLVLVWVSLLVSNQDTNNLDNEFPESKETSTFTHSMLLS